MGKVGRPTKYKREYCDLLIQYMKGGKSFEAFGSQIGGVWKETLYNWTETHPEFLDAKRRGEQLSRDFWETLLIANAAGKLKGNTACVIFGLKNRFPKEWRDRKEVEVSGGNDRRLDDETDALLNQYEDAE